VEYKDAWVDKVMCHFIIYFYMKFLLQETKENNLFANARWEIMYEDYVIDFKTIICEPSLRWAGVL
jgi:hypothetical protein